MSNELKLPDLGDGIESGDILDVLVQEGDQVTQDQGIVEIETDKATVEVPSSQSGRVAKVHVARGQTVTVGQTLITLEAAASESARLPGAAPTTAAGPPAAARPATRAKAEPAPGADPGVASPPPEVRSSGARGEPAQASRASSPDRAERTPPTGQPAPRSPGATTPRAPAKTVPAGPAVRRFAREVGVELASIQGTGPAGRITRDDVLEVVRQASQVARRGPADEPRAEQKAAPTSSNDAWGPVSLEPLTRIRKTIAAKMHESWSTVPRVTNFDDADITELEKMRQASKADYLQAGIKLTSMPFVVKAVAMALRNHPLLNASLDLDNNHIRYKHYVNMGVAVDSERGLVVPSLRNADRLSIADTAKELAALAQKVRDNQFTVDDMRGSTFTISNLGAIGGTYSTPVVNVPEVAILLVGRARKMPIVVDDRVVVRLMMPLSLSYDHRLVDGATAARFLNEVISSLESPSRLLLAP